MHAQMPQRALPKLVSQPLAGSAHSCVPLPFTSVRFCSVRTGVINFDFGRRLCGITSLFGDAGKDMLGLNAESPNEWGRTCLDSMQSRPMNGIHAQAEHQMPFDSMRDVRLGFIPCQR
mmetsp:Transcript_43476/g.71701  ORF Transcript_43476/g.71701 Transcript_43476/m.71701 type:complete len:118 (-) Transcript_43476:21-374(-)